MKDLHLSTVWPFASCVTWDDLRPHGQNTCPHSRSVMETVSINSGTLSGVAEKVPLLLLTFLLPRVFVTFGFLVLLVGLVQTHSVPRRCTPPPTGDLFQMNGQTTLASCPRAASTALTMPCPMLKGLASLP